jgi:phosphotriesterase-related protein
VTVRTVLGDIPAEDLGVCDSHDHLFFRSAQLPGQELDDKDAAAAELRAFRDLGGQAVVQWTPFGLGRRAEWLPELSRATGVHIVAATGMHRLAHYAAPVETDGLADLFVAELTVGIRGSGPRAGLIKVAGAFHHLDAHARQTMTAAAKAHHATGAPISVHHELGTAAPDVAALLIDELGVAADKVILGHLNRLPDTHVHLDLAQTGAFLAFDGPSRANHASDWRLYECLNSLAAHGHGQQVLLGADTTTAAARGAPGMPFLLRYIRPRLGEALAEQFFVHNPARAFSWRQAGLRCAYAA